MFHASVAGTEVFSAGTYDAPAVSPTSICFGDVDCANVEPMLWYGGTIDASGALSDSAVVTSLRSLGMIFSKLIPVPPGGGGN